MFSADGIMLASAGHDGKSIIWDTARSKKIAVLCPSPTGKAVSYVAFSDSAEVLVTVTDEVALYRIGDWCKRLSWRLPIDDAHLVAGNTWASGTISPDGRLLATVWSIGASNREERYIVAIYDVVKRALIDTILVAGKPTAMAFSPNSSSLAVGYGDSIYLWPQKRHVCVDHTQYQCRTIRALAWYPENMKIGFVSDSWYGGTLDINSMSIAWISDSILDSTNDHLDCFAPRYATIHFGPDSRTLAIGAGHSIVLVDTVSMLIRRRVPFAYTVRECSRFLGWCSGSANAVLCSSNYVSIIDVESNERHDVLRSPLLMQGITACAISPVRCQIAYGGGWAKERAVVEVWDASALRKH